MDEIVKRDLPIVREEMDRDEAVKYFNSIGEHYKAEIIGSIPAVRVTMSTFAADPTSRAPVA